MTQRQDVLYVTQQYKTLKTVSDRMLRRSLESKDSRIRFAAALVVGDKAKPSQDVMLKMLLDNNALVRQAARRALIRSSATVINPTWQKTKAVPKFVDFGPTPCCTKEQAEASHELWTAWFEEQEEESPSQRTLDKSLSKKK